MVINFNSFLTVSPGVPERAAFAPVSSNSPPSFMCLAASWLEITDVHTLCLYIRSVFLTKSTQRQIHLS